VVELNRAAAIAQAGDVAGGLARIDALASALDGYQYFHAARADLLRRLGARDAARAVSNWPATLPSARSSRAGSRRCGSERPGPRRGRRS
jgi:predicted RNA polymerase sigma factor